MYLLYGMLALLSSTTAIVAVAALALALNSIVNVMLLLLALTLNSIVDVMQTPQKMHDLTMILCFLMFI